MRPVPKPDVVVKPEWSKCPRCGASLGKPAIVKHHVIEDVPKPQPVIVKDLQEFEGNCPKCGVHVIAKHPDCPSEGRFGKNALIQVSLLKYDERLPHRKIREVLERQYGLSITTASIFDITRRVSDWLKPRYEEIRQRVSETEVVYSDWTGMKVDCRKYWTWDFVTDTEALIVVRKSRGKKGLEGESREKFLGNHRVRW